EEQLEQLVRTVPHQEAGAIDTESLCEICPEPRAVGDGVLRPVHCLELSGQLPLQLRRDVVGALIEMQRHRSRISRRPIGRKRPHGAAHELLRGPAHLRRTSMARAWPCRPSARASDSMAAESAASCPGPYSMTFCRRTKSAAFSGEANRAVPPVGSVWLGPAR